ncbi:MAG: histidine kinase [Caulobacterales bacterium]
MSLRLRIVAAIVLVLVLGSVAGLALAGWHARDWLRGELTAGMAGGELTVARSYEDLPRSDHARRDLVQLIATFDGNRHLRARLLGADGRVIAASNPVSTQAPPPWFAGLLGTQISGASLVPPAPGYRAVELEPVYVNDMAAIWSEFMDLALVLAVSCLGGAVLVWFAVGRALRPLGQVNQAFVRIGQGDYGARVRAEGPPEIVRLGVGVNEMADRLAAMRARTHALEQQILTLQDEERADIARDLHDEIGPHLFAANVDASMTAGLIAAGKTDEALGQVRSIQASIAHMQRLVRDILGRLRPTRLVELGLAAAIADLTDFWRARRPDIRFETSLPADETGLGDAIQETAYRLVQESLSNAVRHGEPGVVRVVLERGPRALAVSVINDGPPARAGSGGFGLSGMGERVAEVGGDIEAGPAQGGGWRVHASLPLGDDLADDAPADTLARDDAA